jgi:hypothetical protein
MDRTRANVSLDVVPRDGIQVVLLANLTGRDSRTPTQVGADDHESAPRRRTAIVGRRNRMALTLFTFGYWGWGSSTQLLLDATRAVEEERGFAAPCFVDVRASRSVRAAGFREKAFEKLAGPDGYVWMPRLGNRRIAERSEGAAEIIDPKAAIDLLDLAIERAQRKQRILFFCACKMPGTVSNPMCHRLLVAELVLKEARRRNLAMGIGEWPGGTPRALDVDLDRKDYMKLVSSQGSFQSSLSLAEVAGLPWGSHVTAHHDGDSYPFIGGPGKPSRGAVVLWPALYGYDDLDAEWRKTEKECGLGWRTVGINAADDAPRHQRRQ